MSYIGENVAVADFSKQTFPADSLEKVFTLSSSVANSSCLIVSVGGVIQEPDVAYTASGTTLTFSVAPTTGNDVYVIYIGKELPKTTHGDNTITNALIPDGSITSDKIQSLVPSKLTGALPAIDGSALTGIAVNTDSLEDNIALLGFKLAANNALAKYNLVDRTIDEYQDATGIDAYNGTAATSGLTDVGNTEHTVTNTGSVAISTSIKKVGTASIEFTRANSSTLGVAAHSDFVFGTADFTIEAWIYVSNLGVRNYIMGNRSVQTDTVWTLVTKNDGKLWWSHYSENLMDSGTTLTVNTWHHVAITSLSRAMTMWLDGVAVDTYTNTRTYSTSAQLMIGLDGDGGQGSSNYFGGNLDEVRISNVARYTSGFTPSTSAFTSDANTKLLLNGEVIAAVPNTGSSSSITAGGTGTGKYYQGESLQAGTLDSTTDVLLHFDEATFVDSSTHSRTVSNSVGSRSATKSKFGGYSLRTTTSPVTGLTVTHTTTKTLCDAFTIDYWFNFDAIVNNQYFYWGTTDLHWGMRFGMSGDNKMQWYLGPGTGDWTISAQSPGTQNGILGTKTDWVAGQWYHHAQVYDGTSYKMYVDGVQDGDALVTSNKISNGVGTGITQSYVGRNSVGSFNGYFDEFRISSGARWTSDFTPPTTAYPEDILTAGADMNLISTSTTASTAPTKGDITVLIEDNLGTATINTDIKGYVSRDGGTGWDQGTLIHEGTWGTNKKVLSFHDQTFSNSASGTDMKYKIETANQSYTVSDTSSTNSYTGANQTFTVPAGITSITFTGWGAGGGGGAPGGIGGGGGFISGNVTVTPGEVLDVKVGGGGQNSGQNNGYDHGGGGGGTGIYRGATVLAIAGAGGGGSGHGAGKATGGSGGGTTGGTAQVNSGGAALGGTQSAGGQGTSGGANTYGSLNQGGSVMDVAGGDGAGGYNGGGKGDNDAGSWTFNSGGGGGGYYGGSSGGESSSSTGPGAGGSSLTAGTNTQAPAYTGAAANNTHANYVAGVGVGGAAMAHGGNGLAIITYSEVSGKQTRIHATSLAWS